MSYSMVAPQANSSSVFDADNATVTLKDVKFYRFSVKGDYGIAKCRSCKTVFSESWKHKCPSCGQDGLLSYYITAFKGCSWTHAIKKTFDDSIVYMVMGTSAAYSKQRNNFFIKRHYYSVRFRTNGQIVVVRDGRKIRDAMHINSILRDVRKIFGLSVSIEDYYKSNNPRLVDILQSVTEQPTEYAYMGSELTSLEKFFYNVKGHDRSRIYRAYDKGGNKEAREALLGKKVKHKRLVSYAWSNLSAVPFIKAGLKGGLDPEQIHSINDDSRLKAVCLLAGLGFSYTRSVNINAKRILEFSEIQDTYNMFTELKKHIKGYVIPSCELKKLHNIVMRDYLIMKASLQENSVLPEHRLKDMVVEEYEFVSAKTEADLVRCGSSMSICVASYADIVRSKATEIYFVKKGGEFIACLQVTNKTLVQAKIHLNYPVASNAAVLSATEEWVVINKLKVETYDLTTNTAHVIRDEGIPF